MSKLKKASRGVDKRDRLRDKMAFMMIFFRAGVVLNRHWRALSTKDRARMARLLRASKGRPGNLNAKQRGELRKLLGKLDLRHLGRDLMLLVGGTARARRRRRR